MHRGVYFDAWFPRQHCYHPSLPPRRLRMVEDLVELEATLLVWSALGGGSLSLPYLEEEAFGEVSARDRFYGFVNDSEFVAECHKHGILVFGVVFEAQGWEFPVELTAAEDQVLALNETRGVGSRGWLGLREFSSNRYPRLWRPVEHYFPDGLVNSVGEPVTDLVEECVARDIHGEPCHARWVECPDREHQCFYMDRNNPVWREYLKAVIRIQVDAGVDGVQLDEAELPMGAFQYGACFCKDCMRLFREHLARHPPAELEGVSLEEFHYGEWLLAQGYDFKGDRDSTPLFGEYYRMQCAAIERYFGELADYARAYGRSRGREVLVSGNFFDVDPSYLALSAHVDLVITEMRNTTYRQPEWWREVAGFASYAGGEGDPKDVVVVENPYGGVVPALAEELAGGRGYDRFRLSVYEGAASGATMTVPYGAWMGSTIQDSFHPPHDLVVEVQRFLAAHDGLRSKRSCHEVAVVLSVASNRELVAAADASDNLTNARDESVRVPYRVVTRELAVASVPFDVVVLADGVTAQDRVPDLARYSTVVLPDCFDLTDRQVAAIGLAQRAGTRVVVTDRVADQVTGTCATAEGVPRLLRDGPQVRGAAGMGVNVARLAEGGAVHLVNYAYDPVADAAVRTPPTRLTVRVPFSVGSATLHPSDGPAVPLEPASESGLVAVDLPPVAVYAVLELRS